MSLEEVFLAALDLPDGALRSQYLDTACGGDAVLRRRVERLLASHFRNGVFLDVPAMEQLDVAGPQSGKGEAAMPSEPEPENLDFFSPSTRADSLGRIAHYEVLQVLGRGGCGIVVRAFDEVLQRVVAVKVMAPEMAATSPARKRFLREARSSAAIRHENVVQVYEVGETPLPYLVMEFIPGETLQQRMDRTGPVDTAEVLRIGRQIAEGLAAAHACELIHRDIKPSNILLEGAAMKVKLTDFGLARTADDASITTSGIVAGTPMFMAPEQALGLPLDHRADLFSLGSVLYQMTSGRPPFRANGILAVLKRVAEETPRPIREIIPETPEWLCTLIAKLHAKNPAERFQSAREVADLLAACETELKSGYTPSHLLKPSRLIARRALLVVAGLTLIAALTVIATESLDVTAWWPKRTPVANVQTAPVIVPVPELVAKVLPARQIELLREELVKRNPGFDGKMEVVFDDDELTSLSLFTDKVSDIAPLKSLKSLRILRLWGQSAGSGQLTDLMPLKGLALTELNLDSNSELMNLGPLKGMPLKIFRAFYTRISDLSPLAGMPLERLDLWAWLGGDLAPLRGMPLKEINIGCCSNPLDLSPLAGMPLEFICINISKTSDLSPLKGMRLKRFLCQKTLVSDLSVLKGMSLTELLCGKCGVTDHSIVRDMPLSIIDLDFDPKRDTALLRGIKTLASINDQPAAEFWKSVEK